MLSGLNSYHTVILFSNVPVFKFGWLGVELFFLISGFVILLTLERCAGFKEFIVRRWLRLFPAMLVCSIIIFFSALYLDVRPAGIPSFLSLIPGLTFIEPSWWRIAFGFPENVLEGAFWSLYVEFKFYVFAAIVYYLKGTRWFVFSLLSVYLFSIVMNVWSLHVESNFILTIKKICEALSFDYFGWFSAGACFYLFNKTNDKDWFFIGLVVSSISSLFVGGAFFDLEKIVAACLISFFFAFSNVSVWLQKIIAHRFFLILGFVSYPFYLVHQNMMISMINALAKFDLNIPLFFIPFFPALFLFFISYFVARFVENGVKRIIIVSTCRLKWVYLVFLREKIICFRTR